MTNMNRRDAAEFFKFVVPSILSFALSGVYAIVDGYFVGNRLGDAGLSAINIAYPIVAFIQAAGTGLGMGGAIRFSIFRAQGRDDKAREFTAAANWLMLAASALLTAVIMLCASPLLRMLGASGDMLALAEQYIFVVTLGTVLQIFGTGLVPLIRNIGNSSFAMIAMVAGFVTNITLDYLFVWVLDHGVAGAAIATVVGQGVTMVFAIAYLIRKKQFSFKISLDRFLSAAASVIRIGIAPFGLAMSPNISLMIINKFSAIYGGEAAVACYACIAYILCILDLVLQGVGDGSQPLISKHYGASDFPRMKATRAFAYAFALALSAIGGMLMFAGRAQFGLWFGTSAQVNAEVARIMPIFLVSVPFVAVTRITTSAFYASERTSLSYILTFAEPVFMLALMLILPPLLGGQIMIWWSTVLARILSAALALLLKARADGQDFTMPSKQIKSTPGKA